jgi:hypothetical protein
LALDTGDDITTPSALKAHKIWIEPAAGDNITAFRITANSGVLWAHHNQTNVINLSESYRNCPVLTAITAKNNIIYANNLYTAFQNCPLLEYLPIINAAQNSVNADNFISNCNSMKTITFKNSDKFNIGRGGYCQNLEQIKADKYLFINVANGLFRNCPKLTKLPSLQFNSNLTSAENVLRNDTSLEPFNIDIQDCASMAKFTCFGENASTILNLKSLRVSNEAPFTGTPPQINVSYTGLDRNALVQLFNDLPYNVGYEVVGSPTIENGVASGFSASDYVLVSNTARLDLRNISMKVRFTVGQLDQSTEQAIFSWGRTGGANIISFRIFINNKLVCYHSGLNSSTRYSFADTVLEEGKTYEAEFGTVNSARYFKCGLAGSMTDQAITTGSDSDFDGTPTAYLPKYIGNIGLSFDRAFTGSIDLNNTYIKVNNVYWFKGTAARAKKPELTITGCTGTADLTTADKQIAEIDKLWKVNY